MDETRKGVLGLVAALLILGGCSANAASPEVAAPPPPPPQEPEAAKPVEMVSVVQLTNGNTLHAKSVIVEGETVKLELPDLGEVVFTKAEIAFVEEIPADRLDELVAQATESQEGFIYAQGQWTTPHTVRRQNQRRTYHHDYYPETEEGLAEAQRALEQAIKTNATSEVQQLKDTIQRIRATLGANRQYENQAKREAERQKEEQQRAKSVAEDAAWRKKTGWDTPISYEKMVRFKQCQSYADPTTGQQVTTCY